jgi:hypothetical protein
MKFGGNDKWVINLKPPVFLGTMPMSEHLKLDMGLVKIKNLGVNALIGNKDIKSMFRLLPIYPGDFDLLGFKLGPYFCIDKCLPMGYSESCSFFPVSYQKTQIVKFCCWTFRFFLSNWYP